MPGRVLELDRVVRLVEGEVHCHELIPIGSVGWVVDVDGDQVAAYRSLPCPRRGPSG